MKGKVATVLMFALILAFLLLLPRRAVAGEDMRYVYPKIETDCEQINVTAYRFHPGDTLNLTFTIQGPVIVWYAENYTVRSEIIYPPGYYTENSYARFCEFCFIDDEMTGFLNMSAGIGTGSDFSWSKHAIPEEGEHTYKIVYLFTGYGNFEGFYEINFLSERYARLEELLLPLNPTQLLVISGVSVAGITFAISAVIWHKKNSTKKEGEAC